MISEDDRRDLADLAMRALDQIIDEYGDGAELCAAVLTFEVRIEDEDGEAMYHGNYKSLPRNTPHHIGGLLYATANYILSPEGGDA